MHCLGDTTNTKLANYVIIGRMILCCEHWWEKIKKNNNLPHIVVPRSYTNAKSKYERALNVKGLKKYNI